ncbi:MAG: hypothetical protein M3R17_15480, partial [Bacteroidota bacterium]|nr:hypothetical protein [Bacteroidota bacterium]
VDFIFNAECNPEIKSNTVMPPDSSFKKRPVAVFPGMKRNAHELDADEPLGMGGEMEKEEEDEKGFFHKIICIAIYNVES